MSMVVFNRLPRDGIAEKIRTSKLCFLFLNIFIFKSDLFSLLLSTGKGEAERLTRSQGFRAADLKPQIQSCGDIDNGGRAAEHGGRAVEMELHIVSVMEPS